MPKDVVVVFVHGINVNCQDYYVPMRDLLLRALPRAARPYVIFRAVFWADIVRGRQQEYLLYARTKRPFSDTPLHRLVIEGLGDAAAYQKTESRLNSAYYEIQGRLRKTIRDAVVGQDDARPLVFVAHSLGCHIVSTYAWDLHTLKASGTAHSVVSPFDEGTRRFLEVLERASAFERLETFAGFVTMGNNMPLFTFTFGPQHVHPITRSRELDLKPAFPGSKLDIRIRNQSRWLNFYSANDPLGYPLKPINDAYDDEPLLSDIHTTSEGFARAMFLRGRFRSLAAQQAHVGYWSDKNVAARTAELLWRIIYAEELAVGRDGWLQRALSWMRGYCGRTSGGSQHMRPHQ